MPALVTHRTVNVDGLNIFYRERGPSDGPAVLLLHGFPTTSHQYRRLMESLPEPFHVIAPDYPGFGYSDAPASLQAGGSFEYRFDRLAEVMERFCEILGLHRFVMYVFDYGGPIGFRIAERHPEWIAGLVVQNANAYVEGLSEGARRFIALRPGMPGAEETISGLITLEGIKAQYLTGVSKAERISPDGWTLDSAFIEQPGRRQIQVELAFDYHSNVERYPSWHEWLRTHQPPTLIVWGRHDPFFLEAGAHAYLRDLPKAQLHIFDTGHFALEDKLHEIAPLVSAFLLETWGR